MYTEEADTAGTSFRLFKMLRIPNKKRTAVTRIHCGRRFLAASTAEGVIYIASVNTANPEGIEFSFYVANHLVPDQVCPGSLRVLNLPLPRWPRLRDAELS
jgi:hypothetical protein